MKKSVLVESQNNGDGEDDFEEHIIDAGDPAEDDDSPAAEEAALDAEENGEDDGQVAHDDAVVRSIHDMAIRDMATMGVRMSVEEEKEALKLFPAVCLHFNLIYNAHPKYIRFLVLHAAFMITQLLTRSSKTSLTMTPIYSLTNEPLIGVLLLVGIQISTAWLLTYTSKTLYSH